MTDDLGPKIYALLVEEAPDLLSGDLDANARCCGALSDILGRLMADLVEAQGSEFFEHVKRMVFSQIEATTKRVLAEGDRDERTARGSRH